LSLILDTSGVLAFVNRHDPDHEAVRTVILEESGALIVPMGIMAEIGYMLEQRLGLRALDAFLNDLETGQFTLDAGLEDLPRVRTLVNRYSSLPLGFADSVVISCAERFSKRVLTLDQRHFTVVGREVGLALLP
jgi:predicted nucleic acid-binding protein